MKLTKEQKIDFMKKAMFIADKSTCGYKIGCVGVIKDTGQKLNDEFKQKDGFIYTKTWNETLPGEIYCRHECIRIKENLKGRDPHKVCSIHAEANLIARCARHGISTKGMIIFVTNSPCIICARSLVQAGVSEIYYMAEHTERDGLEFLRRCKSRVEKFSKVD